MGCASSKNGSVSIDVQTSIEVEVVSKKSKLEPVKLSNIKEDVKDLSMLIDYPDYSEAKSSRERSIDKITINETLQELNENKNSSSSSLSNHPTSQSAEIADEPINVVEVIGDESKFIDSYIKTAVEYRNSKGGRCNLEKQLKHQRLELICIGRFIQENRQANKYDILSYDQRIDIDGKRYRPDLILKDTVTHMIVHVEIDEFAHSAYNDNDEATREQVIERHFRYQNYQRIRFNPNAYSSKLEMAIAFSQLLLANDGLLSACFKRAEKRPDESKRAKSSNSKKANSSMCLKEGFPTAARSEDSPREKYPSARL